MSLTIEKNWRLSLLDLEINNNPDVYELDLRNRMESEKSANPLYPKDIQARIESLTERNKKIERGYFN